MYYVITLYPNYVHEFNYVKPIGPYHYHVLRLLISEYYVHWFDYNLMLNKILCLVYIEFYLERYIQIIEKH